MNKFEEAKQLRIKAGKLEEQAEKELMPALLDKYKDLVGTCLRLIERGSSETWTSYCKITKIERINVNRGENDTVSVQYLSFSPDEPYQGFTLIENDHGYYHILLAYGHKITSKEFDKQLEKCLKRIGK